MKKIALLCLTIFASTFLFADELIYIKTSSEAEVKQCFADKNITVNYYTDHFVIATATGIPGLSYELVDADAWTRDGEYFIARFNNDIMEDYSSEMSQVSEILLVADDFMIIKASSENVKNLFPAIHGGLINIGNIEAKLPVKRFDYTKGAFREDPLITELISYVNTDSLIANVQHLQDYGTRNAYQPESIEAQNWLKSRFESFGLETELFDFTMPGGPASDDVIATIPGTVYPDQFIVLGGHYDSYSYSGGAPGADDDASGTSGILEIARILSEYQFKRTIILCTWSGEEYGLYGSAAWASWAAGENMDILGYFNIDMSGYLQPGSYIHTDVIAPSSAQELVGFYTDVASIYLPGFPVEPGALSGGDSDHTSFNNNGYMGIFPFEDSQAYSPHIHTSNDLIGPSVNTPEQVKIFTQATLASVVAMANMLTGPSNLIGIANDGSVELIWDELVEAASYNIYKNGDLLVNLTETEYLDEDVVNGETYNYYVTAIYQESGDESVPSNIITVIPMPPMTFPFIEDYETGAPYWTFEDSWGLSEVQSNSPTHSMTESPEGDYTNNLNIFSVLKSFSLEGASGANLTFMTRYALESAYDYMYLEISTNANNWTELDEFNGTQNSWTGKSYSLDEYIGEPFVLIRFRMFSDVYVTEDGMYIDDLEIELLGVGIDGDETENNQISIFPNPFSDKVTLQLQIDNEELVKITVYDLKGQQVSVLADDKYQPGMYFISWKSVDKDGKALDNGTYFIITEVGPHMYTEKVILAR